METIKRNVLLNPGPATTRDTVKYAQIVPDICPREKEFGNLMRQFRKDLLRIVHASEKEYTSVLFCGSGTINMDVCINSLLPKDKKILIINNGAYSSRAVEIAEAYGLSCVNLSFPVDERPNLEKIENILRESRDISLVYSTHNETGTGLLNPVREIGALAHKYDCIHVTDTTSTFAMRIIDMEKDNIDFCMSSAQKGLMGMTGLSFIVGKRKEIEKSKDYPRRSYYCNLYLQYDYFEKTGEMHFTPPVQTLYAAVQALKEYFDEGEERKWHRHLAVTRKIHEWIDKLGFQEVIPRDWQSGLVVAIKYPEDKKWNFEKIHDYCYSRGYTIYPGKILGTDTFRLCSLGAIEPEDIDGFFEIFIEALKKYGVALPEF